MPMPKPKLESKIVSIERRLDELEETVEILGDSKTTRSIERGLTDLREGRFRKYETAEALFRKVRRG
ncbi:MAG: hypothetical protein ABSF83_04560 [Nitrososphaerales archaeon]|jgi:hypothetical protein